MSADDSFLSELQEGRRRFLALVEGIRPDLHRYCARMTGSAADGEDVVQDTLARAYYELSELKELPALRAWLFRIAHNQALDQLRRRERRDSLPLEDALALADTGALVADEALAAGEAVRVAVSRFVELAPLQRSCVILKDVLGHSSEEIAQLLDSSVPAVKAALHRGRARLHALAAAPPTSSLRPAPSPAMTRYAALFNARDWDGVRAMLREDVRLDLVSKLKGTGRRQVGSYFSNYDSLAGWRLAPAWLDGREGLAVFRKADDVRPSSFVELTVREGGVARIRDYRYVPYLLAEASLELA